MSKLNWYKESERDLILVIKLRIKIIPMSWSLVSMLWVNSQNLKEISLPQLMKEIWLIK